MNQQPVLCVGGPKNGQYIDLHLQFYEAPIYSYPKPSFRPYRGIPEILTVTKLFTYKLTDVRIPYLQNGKRFYYIPKSWSNSDLFDYFERAVIAYENQNP